MIFEIFKLVELYAKYQVHSRLIFEFFKLVSFLLGFQNGLPVQVKITNVQKTELPRSETLRHRQLNPYLYNIEVTHGQTSWFIKKRYGHFLKLHTAIVFSRSQSIDDPDTNDKHGNDGCF